MADSVPYGFLVEQLEEAPPAAKAVAARLSHIVLDTEWWGEVRIDALFLNMVMLWDLPHGRREMYHRVCRPQFEAALFEGLDALERHFELPAEERDMIRLVRDYRTWRVAEDTRPENRPRIGQD